MSLISGRKLVRKIREIEKSGVKLQLNSADEREATFGSSYLEGLRNRDSSVLFHLKAHSQMYLFHSILCNQIKEIMWKIYGIIKKVNTLIARE